MFKNGRNKCFVHVFVVSNYWKKENVRWWIDIKCTMCYNLVTLLMEKKYND